MINPDRFQHIGSRLATAVLIAAALTMSASAQLVKGAPAPALKATDIKGNDVDLDAIIASQPQPKLLVEFLFSTTAGEEIANKLAYLHTRYGKEMLQIIGLGIEEDKEALKKFAEGMGIQYYIIDAATLDNAEWIKNINALPVTIFIYPDEKKTIAKVIQGGGEEQANIIKEIASNFLAQGRPQDALKVVEVAIEQGEDADDVKAAGQVKVALAEGNLAEAESILDGAQMPDAYSSTLMGTVRMLQGKVAEAGDYFAKAAAMPSGDDWQKAEALNGQGRVLHANGDVVAALASYEQAIAENPWEVPAITNAAEIHRTQGELDEAAKLLQDAKATGRGDAVSDAMLRQVVESMDRANNAERAQLVQKQIADLGARYKEMQADGTDKLVDPWTSRPLVLAFLPADTQQVFFARAGLDTVIQRELEFTLQQRGDVSVVEREFLDQLLQELNLSANDLTSAETKQQLGQVLAARWLGVIEFVGAGNEVGIYTRLADAESTSLIAQVSRTIDARADLAKMIQGMADEIMAGVMKEQGPLQGLIIDASDEGAILVNLGKQHSLQPGQRFDIVESDPPTQVGARTINGRLKRLGSLEITEVDQDTATAKVLEKKDGVALAPETKIRQAKE